MTHVLNEEIRLRAFWSSTISDEMSASEWQRLVAEFVSINHVVVSNSFAVIFHLQSQKVLKVIGESQGITGYSVEEYQADALRLYFRIVSFQHISVPLKAALWVTINKRKISFSRAERYETHLAGVTIKHREAYDIRLLFRAYPLKFSDNGAQTVVIVYVNDVTHFMKKDVHWYFIKNQESISEVISYQSESGQTQYGPPLSERELEVLRLVKRGLSTAEIAEKLFISESTVLQHKKNSITKLGAQNTTSAVELMHLCGLI